MFDLSILIPQLVPLLVVFTVAPAFRLGQRDSHNRPLFTQRNSFNHLLLDQRGICCSAGSACTTGQHEPSHVLRAMGHDDTRARGTLRFSFGRFNTPEQIARALDIVPQVVEKVRRVNG